MSASGWIGLVVGVKKGRLLVIRAAADTPAHRAGLRAGDHIVRIDEAETASMDQSEAIARLKGPPGARLVLWVAREGHHEPLRFEVVREAREESAWPAGTAKLFLGLAGVLVFAAAIVALTWTSTSPHREGATTYARLVREKEPRAAYELLANERRRELTYEAWLHAMNTPLLARAADVSVSAAQSNSTGRGCARATVVTDGDTVALTFFTLDEGDGVRIHSVMTNEEQSGFISRAPWRCD